MIQSMNVKHNRILEYNTLLSKRRTEGVKEADN